MAKVLGEIREHVFMICGECNGELGCLCLISMGAAKFGWMPHLHLTKREKKISKTYRLYGANTSFLIVLRRKSSHLQAINKISRE